MTADLVEMALGTFGETFAATAGAIVVVYIFVALIETVRRAFIYRE